MTTSPLKIIWTKTDEAPMLASYSLLPIVRHLLKTQEFPLKAVIFHFQDAFFPPFRKS